MKTVLWTAAAMLIASAAYSPRAHGQAREEAALAAYNAMTTAYGRGDADAYFGAYAETLRCFYGRPNVARVDVRAARAREVEGNTRGRGARVQSIETRPLRASANEVELVDYGWTGVSMDEGMIFHAKRIVLSRIGGAWRVVVETPARGDACGLAPLAADPPAMWSDLRRRWVAMLDGCVGPPGATLEDGYPGIAGSNGCMPSTNFPSDGEEWCTDLRDPKPECRTLARSVLNDLFGADGPLP
jgi:hypothetical protein